MLKVVLDTNQFVSSIITKKGTSAQLLQAWRESAYVLIASREILRELQQVLLYPHITKKYPITETGMEALFSLIDHEAIVLSETPEVDIIKEDPEDNKIIACAIETKADYIVSGDKHLLSLRKYNNTQIVTARELLDIIKYEA